MALWDRVKRFLKGTPAPQPPAAPPRIPPEYHAAAERQRALQAERAAEQQRYIEQLREPEPVYYNRQDEFEHLSDMYGISGDDELENFYGDIIEPEIARTFLWQGFFEEGVWPEERRLAREDFYAYMAMEPSEFAWQDWKEWYAAYYGT